VATAHRARLRAQTLRSRFRPASIAITAVTAALLAVAGPVPVGQAAPQLTISEAQARIDALNSQAEKITEDYNAAREKLTTLKRQQDVAARQLHGDQRRLATVQASIATTADATYRTGGLGQFVLGAATDPQSFLDQASLLDALSRSQAQQFASADAAGHAVRVAQSTYTAQADAVRQALSRISSQRRHIEALLSQARHVLDSLQAAARARLAAAQTAQAAHQTALRSSYTGPASGQAAAAVRFAYNQLGKPYQYGAAGPGSYDCSGLTMAAWGAAGVALPHNAAMQQSQVRAVSAADAQPGDLVFFGSPAYHVGIYIGGGRMIAAPHTGTVVQIQAVYSGVSGYGRP
jgi:cell wall-associated NlpC family hydrolase